MVVPDRLRDLSRAFHRQPRNGRPGSDDRAAGARRGQRLALTALAILLVTLLYSIGVMEPAENRLSEARARMLDRPPTGQIVIVEIDARSLSKLRTWPWSRRYHATLVRNLHDRGASLIAFDVDFSSLSEPVGDRAFAEALRDSEPVILPIFQQRASQGSSHAAVIESRPAPLFSAAWVGGVNIFPDAQGVVRDYPAATVIGGEIRPSVATLLAEKSGLGDRAFQPDWSIDVNRIPRLSFVDVMENRVPRSAIAGKRILIGATAVELGDHYVVPRYGTIPGVVIQALAAESILQDRSIARSGPWFALAGILVVCGALGLGRYARFNRSFPVAAGAVCGIIALAPILAQSRWPVSIDSAAMWFSALICIAGRVALEVRRKIVMRSRLDAETGLPNRLALDTALVAGTGKASTLAVAAIDRFDSIRDAMGIAVATALVSETARRIAQHVNGPVYRIGPDVLAWLPTDRFHDNSDDHLAGLFRRFREPVATSDGPVDVVLTVGLHSSPATAGTELNIERSLAAISAARSAGQPFQWFQGADPAARRQVSLMGELRRAMAAGDVTLAYQPKVSLGSGDIAHVEALVRWNHPDEGPISPDRFIPLAESTGVVSELTAFVLDQAVADCARWNALAMKLCVAVNVSAADLADVGFADRVKAVLARHDVDPRSLTLEVTESAIIRSAANAIEMLENLREFGIRLSVDDYGTGQSTLSYLKDLPVHELKIDKAFVSSMSSDDGDRIMVRSTIDMAHELGLQVVAEGIEDGQTLALLRSLGCDYAQGYFLGKAMSFDDLCTRLSQGSDARHSA